MGGKTQTFSYYVLFEDKIEDLIVVAYFLVEQGKYKTEIGTELARDGASLG